MEFVIVTYPQDRALFIDGAEAGMTNTLLRIEAGTHTFNLGEPRDYVPKWRRKVVRDTTSIAPMEIGFDPA
jgi:hypothetical protein